MIEFVVGAGIGSSLMWMYKCRCDDDRVDDSVREGTQAYQVREILQQGKYLTCKYARDELGIKNLTSVVDKLRKAGVEVKLVEGDYGNYYTL
jgi:hypothetical protein